MVCASAKTMCRGKSIDYAERCQAHYGVQLATAPSAGDWPALRNLGLTQLRSVEGVLSRAMELRLNFGGLVKVNTMPTKSNKINPNSGVTTSFGELITQGLITDKTVRPSDKLPIVKGDVIRLPEGGQVKWETYDTDLGDGTLVNVRLMEFNVVSSSGLNKKKFLSLADLTRLPLQKAYGDVNKNLRWFIGGAFDASLDAQRILDMLCKGLVVDYVVHGDHKKDCYALKVL